MDKNTNGSWSSSHNSACNIASAAGRSPAHHQQSNVMSIAADAFLCKQCKSFDALEECYQKKDLECDRLRLHCRELEVKLEQLRVRCSELEKSLLQQNSDLPQSLWKQNGSHSPDSLRLSADAGDLVSDDGRRSHIECDALDVMSSFEDLTEMGISSTVFKAQSANQSPGRTKSSSCSSFEILDVSEPDEKPDEFLFGSWTISLSQQLRTIAEQMKSMESCEVKMRSSSKHAEQRQQLTELQDAVAAVRADCEEQIAKLHESYKSQLSLLRAEYDKEISRLQLSQNSLSDITKCCNCEELERRLANRCRKLERQIQVIDNDFQLANKKNKEYECEITFLKDECNKLRDVIHKLQTTASATAEVPVVSYDKPHHLSSPAHNLSPVLTSGATKMLEVLPPPAAKMSQWALHVGAPAGEYNNSTSRDVTSVWSCPRCTYDNLQHRNYCEICNCAKYSM